MRIHDKHSCPLRVGVIELKSIKHNRLKVNGIFEANFCLGDENFSDRINKMRTNKLETISNEIMVYSPSSHVYLQTLLPFQK